MIFFNIILVQRRGRSHTLSRFFGHENLATAGALNTVRIRVKGEFLKWYFELHGCTLLTRLTKDWTESKKVLHQELACKDSLDWSLFSEVPESMLPDSIQNKFKE